MACQQNTQKSNPTGEGENTTAQVSNDLDQMLLKGKVKTFTQIVYEGEEKDGQVIKKKFSIAPPSIIRTHFNPQGFTTLVEIFDDLSMEKPYSVEKYFYNEKGQLDKTTLSRTGRDLVKDFYSYNEQGDKILHTREDPSEGGLSEFKYLYNYTPEGKEITSHLSDSVKTISYYNKKNLLVKEETYSSDGGTANVNTYDDKGLLIKIVSYADNTEVAVTTLSYDKYGNQTSSVTKIDNGSFSTFNKYEYDSKGNVIKQECQYINTFVDEEGINNEDKGNYVVTYTLDAQGNKTLEVRKNSDQEPRIVITEYQIEYY